MPKAKTRKSVKKTRARRARAPKINTIVGPSFESVKEAAARQQSDDAALLFIKTCHAAVLLNMIPDLITELAVAILREGEGGVVEAQDINLLRWMARKMLDNRKTEAGRPVLAVPPIADRDFSLDDAAAFGDRDDIQF